MNLLPPKLAAAKCGVSITTMRRWRKDEGLEFPLPRMVKGRRFWLDAEIDVWLASLPVEPQQQ